MNAKHMAPARRCGRIVKNPKEIGMENKIEGFRADPQNLEQSGARNCRGGGIKRSASIAYSARRQTLEEQRQCEAAIQLLLAELVRQQLGCGGQT